MVAGGNFPICRQLTFSLNIQPEDQFQKIDESGGQSQLNGIFVDIERKAAPCGDCICRRRLSEAERTTAPPENRARERGIEKDGAAAGYGSPAAEREEEGGGGR